MSGKVISPYRKIGNISRTFSGNLHFTLAYNPISSTAIVVGLCTMINWSHPL